MSLALCQAEGMDRISVALQKRREQVAAEEWRDQESRRGKRKLVAFLGQGARLDQDYLVSLLQLTWERLPCDLSVVGWESPTTDDEEEALGEALSIGAAVADVFAVYAEQEESHGGD
jgi:hypothetical protein